MAIPAPRAAESFWSGDAGGLVEQGPRGAAGQIMTLPRPVATSGWGSGKAAP